MPGLQELRDQIAKEEEQPQEAETTTEVDEPELEIEAEDEAATVESDESDEVDEIDLSLDDDEDSKQTKPTPEQALVFKLTKEKKRRQEVASELEKLKAENEALKAGQYRAPPTQQPQQVDDQFKYPPIPVLYEDGINTPDQYRKAYEEWERQRQDIDRQRQQRDQQSINAVRLTQERAERLATRASGFIKSNKIKPDMATSTIQAGIQGLDEALGIDGVALDLLDMIGDGSEKLAYYLGKNPQALAMAKQLHSEDPRGLKVNTWLANTAFKLNQKTKHISKAPEPDTPLTPDGPSASAAALQAKYDKTSDFTEMRELRKKAEKLGITLK